MNGWTQFIDWIRSLRSRLKGSDKRDAATIVTGRIVLARYMGRDRPPPLHWKDCHPSTRRRFKAELTCSRGHGISLKAHGVRSDGSVEPSIVCLHPGCDFHEFVRLDGWTAGALSPSVR